MKIIKQQLLGIRIWVFLKIFKYLVPLLMIMAYQNVIAKAIRDFRESER